MAGLESVFDTSFEEPVQRSDLPTDRETFNKVCHGWLPRPGEFVMNPEDFGVSRDPGPGRSAPPKQDLIVFDDDDQAEDALVDLTVDTAVATHPPIMWDAQSSVSRWFDLPEDSADGRSTLTSSRREEEPSATSRAEARPSEHDDSASDLTLTPSRRTESPAAVASAEASDSVRTPVEPSSPTSPSRQLPRASPQARQDLTETTAEGHSATAQVAVIPTAETLVDRLSWIRAQELDLD